MYRRSLSEVSGLNVRGTLEKLRETITRQGDGLAETCRRNSRPGGGLQQLEEVNRLLGESNEG
jgi:hypothetical protein